MVSWDLMMVSWSFHGGYCENAVIRRGNEPSPMEFDDFHPQTPISGGLSVAIV